MQKFDAWWFPDGEQHIPENMLITDRRVDGRLTYQFHKYVAAMKHVTRRRVAVDIGAHVGLWSFWMANDFIALHAFEPVPTSGECWGQNVPMRAGVEFHPVALGAAVQRVGMHTRTATSSGNTWVQPSGSDVEMRTLDSYDLTDVDLIKIDCEGYEAFVIDGGLDTIRRCRPVIIVEQKPGWPLQFSRGEIEAVEILESLGAERQWMAGGDYCLAFPAA